jgi:para-nitrobenzyl esterase
MGSPITKMTTYGPIVGRVDAAGIERYFGIRTAADAGGANRWRAPQPPTSWSSPLQTVVEKHCLQQKGGTEDCLSVDVLTVTGLTGMAVFCYIHGGGFALQDPPYYKVTGGYYQKGGVPSLPNSGRSVSVFFHYRLGGLGFMAHPGLSAETTYGGSGNYGMMDSINNLQWVQQNIGTFGGDSSLVTIVGESAGGAHVVLLTASPLSAGLFKHMIAQSPYISWKPGTFSLGARYAMASMYASATGCGSIGIPSGSTAASVVACMRTKDGSAFTADGASPGGSAFDAVYGSGSSGLFLYNSVQCWPVVDGFVLTAAPLASWASGVGSEMNFIIGHVRVAGPFRIM